MAKNTSEVQNFQFRKNDTVSLRQHVYQEIREAIIKGNLEPGSRIKEVEIATQMGISRGPVREAIRLLEQEGLVISHPYRETVVVELSEDEMRQILVPTRRNFELYAARIANRMLLEQDFGFLEDLLLQMQKAADEDNLDEISSLDLQFHEYMVEKCVSPGMFRIWKSISGKLHSRFLIQGYSHSTLQTVVEEHRELYALIREGDFDKTALHLKKHIT